MISTALLALAMLPALGTPATAAPVAVSAPAEWNSCGYYPSTNLKLRTGPTAGATAVGILTPKDTVRILKESGRFYQVSLDGTSETGLKAGTTGWVTKHLQPHACMRLDGS